MATLQIETDVTPTATEYKVVIPGLRDDNDVAPPRAILRRSNKYVIKTTATHEESDTGGYTGEREAEFKLDGLMDARLVRLDPETGTRKFNILQRWEGIVVERNEAEIVAILENLVDSESQTEIVTIPIEEIPPSDRGLLNKGGVFYWHIGYHTSSGGTLCRVSEIRARRTPIWTEQILEQVKIDARELFVQVLGNDHETTE